MISLVVRHKVLFVLRVAVRRYGYVTFRNTARLFIVISEIL